MKTGIFSSDDKFVNLKANFDTSANKELPGLNLTYDYYLVTVSIARKCLDINTNLNRQHATSTVKTSLLTRRR